MRNFYEKRIIGVATPGYKLPKFSSKKLFFIRAQGIDESILVIGDLTAFDGP